MAKTYEQLQKQIADLQAAADKVRRKELDGVITRIREAIDFYELTPTDLGFGAGAAKKTSAKKKTARQAAAKPARVVTYSNGAGGTWGGRGKRPQWLRDALTAGRALEEFKVKAD